MLRDASRMTVRGLICGHVSGEGGMGQDGDGVVRKRGWEGDEGGDERGWCVKGDWEGEVNGEFGGFVLCEG